MLDGLIVANFTIVGKQEVRIIETALPMGRPLAVPEGGIVGSGVSIGRVRWRGHFTKGERSTRRNFGGHYFKPLTEYISVRYLAKP